MAMREVPSVARQHAMPLQPGRRAEHSAPDEDALPAVRGPGIVHSPWMRVTHQAGSSRRARIRAGIHCAWPERCSPAASGAEFVEGTRLLGSLERIAFSRKLELAGLLFNLVLKGKATNQPHVFWALRRLLSRVPLYTGAETVMPAARGSSA